MNGDEDEQNQADHGRKDRAQHRGQSITGTDGAVNHHLELMPDRGRLDGKLGQFDRVAVNRSKKSGCNTHPV